MKAVGYVRVSTTEQATEGVSLEAQRSAIKAWAASRCAELVGIEADEGVSGSRDDRPGLARAVRLACKHRGILVVYSLSRMARSTLKAIEVSHALEKAGAQFASLTEAFDTSTASGACFFRIMASVAELERDLACERVQFAMDHLRATGRRRTRPDLVPYGWRVVEGGGVEPAPEERARIARMVELRESGHPWRAVARVANAEGWPTRTGARWSAGVCRDIVARESPGALAGAPH